MLTEIYLWHACSYQNIEDENARTGALGDHPYGAMGKVFTLESHRRRGCSQVSQTFDRLGRRGCSLPASAGGVGTHRDSMTRRVARRLLSFRRCAELSPRGCAR
eukprot:COSAG01_NODE_14998_length_1386_cov_11.425796_1_plen_104_part_00